MTNIDFHLEAKRLQTELDVARAIYACNDGQTGVIGDDGIEIIKLAMRRIADLATGKLSD